MKYEIDEHEKHSLKQFWLGILYWNIAVIFVSILFTNLMYSYSNIKSIVLMVVASWIAVFIWKMIDIDMWINKK